MLLKEGGDPNVEGRDGSLPLMVCLVVPCQPWSPSPFYPQTAMVRVKWGRWSQLTRVTRHTTRGHSCWIEVKVAVLCARQYMPWNLFLIKILNNFWHFKHQILTRISSEAYLKRSWRNCIWNIIIFEDNFFNYVKTVLLNPSRNQVFKISRIIQNFDYKRISMHVLVCKQRSHLKLNLTHCACVLLSLLSIWGRFVHF